MLIIINKIVWSFTTVYLKNVFTNKIFDIDVKTVFDNK